VWLTLPDCLSLLKTLATADCRSWLVLLYPDNAGTVIAELHAWFFSRNCTTDSLNNYWREPVFPYIILNESVNHTHKYINGPFSGTTQVSRYQRGKTNQDFTEARDSEWQWNPLSAPRSRLITTPAAHHSVFYKLDALPATQPTASKHWRHIGNNNKTDVKWKSERSG